MGNYLSQDKNAHEQENIIKLTDNELLATFNKCDKCGVKSTIYYSDKDRDTFCVDKIRIGFKPNYQTERYIIETICRTTAPEKTPILLQIPHDMPYYSFPEHYFNKCKNPTIAKYLLRVMEKNRDSMP